MREGVSDCRSDVYSLAATIYFCLLYKEADKRGRFKAKLLPGDVPAEMRSFLEKCLDNDPDERPKDAGDFVQEWCKPKGTEIAARPRGEVPRPPTDEKHWRDNYPRAHECATWYQSLLRNAGGDVRQKFTKGWITLYLNGKVRVSVPARKSDQVQVYIQKLNDDDLDEAEKKLNSERTVCTRTEENHLLVTGKLAELKESVPVHEWVAKLLVKGQEKGTS